MPQQTRYQKHSLTKIIFALAFLISLSFSPGYVNYVNNLARQKTKTELVVSYKAKTPKWIKSLYKKVNAKTFTKSPASIKYELVLLQAYNKLTKIKFDNLKQHSPLIKSPGCFYPLKTVPQSSKENDFISFAG